MECACCFRLFPIAVLPLSVGTLGLRQSCVAMAAGCVAELCTPGIWSLSRCIVSISLPFIPSFSQFFLRCSRGYQRPAFSQLLSVSTAYHPQKYTHIRNETHRPILENKMHVHTSACMCFYQYLPLSTSSFHFLCSCLHFISWPFPCGGSTTALRDTTVPRVPWHSLHHCLQFTLKHSSAFHRTVLQILIP